MKKPIQLITSSGDSINTTATLTPSEEFPAIIVLDELGNPLRGFYCVGTRERGQLGVYHECDTEKVSR